LGSYFEYFDLFIAGIAAGTAWPAVFFSGLPTNMAFALSIVSMGVLFLARPVGACIFGYVGDRVGRRTATMWTLIVMGVAAGGIGLLPGIVSIGFLAPVLLVILRIIQGIGLGGEVGAGATWIIEAAAVAKSKHRGFWASWVQFGSPFGNVTSSMLTAYLVGLGTGSYISFGWRIPFLVGAVVAVIGGFARFKLLESPLFVRIREERKLAKNPPAAVIREKWKTLLPITATVIPEMSGTAIMIAPYTILFLTALHVNPTFAAGVGIYQGGGACISTVVGAILCDRVGRKIFAVLNAIVGIIFCFPFFIGLGAAAGAGNTLIMILILMGWGAGLNILNGPLPAISAESFETKYRISGSGLSIQLTGLFVGLVVTFVLSYIIAAEGTSVEKVWPSVAGLMLVLSVIGLIGALLIKETKNIEI
jgi:MFS family permease